MRLNSPVKHLYREAVVCVTATISGLRFPFITTSMVGMPSKRNLTSFADQRVQIP